MVLVIPFEGEAYRRHGVDNLVECERGVWAEQESTRGWVQSLQTRQSHIVGHPFFSSIESNVLKKNQYVATTDME